MLAPRGAYARLGSISPSYIVYYVLFMSLLIAAAASVSTTGRVTLSLLVSLSVSWMFVPLLHVLIAAVLVASVRAPRVRRPHAVALLMMGHAPWSLWLLMAAFMIAIGGYNGYRLTPLVAVPAVILTCRIVRAFCLEVLQTSARGAVLRTLAHQAVTWLIVTIYLEKAVGLLPRVYGWLS
jgi:hypothetical protein